MKKYFSVGEAARAVGMTSETLRHYDRIGLVKPGKKDEWTGYRYYTELDIVRLNTVKALQSLDLPLREIKRVLEYDELEEIVGFLAQAEKKLDEKIAALHSSKAKLQTARANYESKLGREMSEEVCVKDFPTRVILLSDNLEKPTLDNLWNYLAHFYDKLDPAVKEQFEFEDMAGVYSESGRSRLFALCTRHTAAEGLRVLPQGRYLCADCAEEEREELLRRLVDMARTNYGAEPAFTLELVVVSGILRWNYQLQIPI